MTMSGALKIVLLAGLVSFLDLEAVVRSAEARRASTVAPSSG